jgi:hypothetical protein
MARQDGMGRLRVATTQLSGNAKGSFAVHGGFRPPYLASCICIRRSSTGLPVLPPRIRDFANPERACSRCSRLKCSTCRR